jgi:hypothetical protein
MLWNLVAAALAMTKSAPAMLDSERPAMVEITFATNVGEGAAGSKRFSRDGCYQIESGGGTGGSGYARDSQAGCYRPTDVAPVFEKITEISFNTLEREHAAPGSATRGAPARNLMAGGTRTNVVVVRVDGSRWLAVNEETANRLVAAVNELPSENQWYAKPPEKPVGSGAQLLVLSVATSGGDGSRRTEATLASDGRWWCHRSVVGPRGGDQKLPAKKVLPVKDAAARLGRILEGVSRGERDETQAAPEKRSDGSEISVQVAWPGQDRTPLRGKQLAGRVVDRFAGEMQALAPSCAIRAAPSAR